MLAYLNFWKFPSGSARIIFLFFSWISSASLLDFSLSCSHKVNRLCLHSALPTLYVACTTRTLCIRYTPVSLLPHAARSPAKFKRGSMHPTESVRLVL
ncbi:hypothetical protein C8R43DRAFT_1040488, partial [Mycena crocata]